MTRRDAAVARDYLTQSMIASLTFLLFAGAHVPPVTKATDSGRASAGARRIVAECDRVVLARVGTIREYELVAKSRVATDPTQLRVAELVVEEAWCGLPEEPIHVRVSLDWTPPEGIRVWGLEPARGIHLEDWKPVGAARETTVPHELWQRRASLGSPWPLRTTGAQREIELPPGLADSRSAMPSASSTMFATSTRRWIDVEHMRADLACALETSSAVSAEVVSNGPRGCWTVQVDDEGRGVTSYGRTFRWSAAQRAQWREAVELSRIERMPGLVGISTGPCLGSTSLTAVTRNGRRMVRSEGVGLEDETPAAREQLDRFHELWRVLDSLLPRDR